MKTTPYRLIKWRRCLVIRDARYIRPGGDKLSTCVLCGPDTFHRPASMQAHHIKPKSLFPELALDLDNGVMLCTAHHLGIVHNNNSFQDIMSNDIYAGWTNFVSMFKRWNDLSINKKFNEKNQAYCNK